MVIANRNVDPCSWSLPLHNRTNDHHASTFAFTVRLAACKQIGKTCPIQPPSLACISTRANVWCYSCSATFSTDRCCGRHRRGSSTAPSIPSPRRADSCGRRDSPEEDEHKHKHKHKRIETNRSFQRTNMASVVVMDSALKRTAVKVSPGTHMRDVLEQACQARKISPELYALRSKADKTVDLSQPFRLSGLTSGATLTLVQASRTPSVVNVALQLPDSEGGGRLSDKFPSTTSLWLILRKFEDAVAGQLPRKLNITQRAVPYEQTAASGRLEYEQPCLHIMGRNLESFVDLQKTLAQLGYNSGTALLRLNFKCVGQPLEEAMQEIEEYFKSVDVPSAGVAPATATATELDRDSPMPDADTPPASSIENVGVAASSKVRYVYSLAIPQAWGQQYPKKNPPISTPPRDLPTSGPSSSAPRNLKNRKLTLLSRPTTTIAFTPSIPSTMTTPVLSHSPRTIP